MPISRFVWFVLLASFLWPFGVWQMTGHWPRPTGSMDFQDGVRLEYEMSAKDLAAKKIVSVDEIGKALNSAKDTFRFRLKEFEGRKEFSVRTSGTRTLIVEVPGVQDLEAVMALIGHAQVLTFRELKEGKEHPPVPLQPCFKPDGGELCEEVGEPIFDYSKFDYANVHVDIDPEDPTKFGVAFAAKPDFRMAWYTVTKKYYGKLIAICLDESIKVQAHIKEDGIQEQGIITSYATAAAARDVERLLKAGPLPVSFENTQQRQLGRSVGPEMLNTAFKVMGIGLAAMCVFLFLAYSNNPELFMIILFCQSVQASFVYFLSSQGYFALSLLSLCALGIMSGVCVDNLILVNEEILIVNAGGPRGMRASFTAAFEKFDEEWHVIWKANLLSIAPVFPLFFLGEPVSGLVATMASASLFALAFVWLILRALLQSDWIVAGLRNMSRPVRPIMTFRFNLWDWRRELRLLYGLAAIGSLALIFSKGLVQSIDFEAGTEVTLQADRQFDQGQLERAASDYFKRRSTVRTLEGGGAPTFLFLVPGFGPNTQGQSRYAITVDGLVTHLNSTLPARFEQKSANSAGANVTGISLRAFLICALIGISSLLAFLLSLYRFRVAFAIVVAMLLDATVALGALSLTSVPLSLPILSSLLAIVGYSVYDSVVIAEHLKGDLVSRANRNRAADDVVAETLGKLTRRFVLTVTSTALSALSIAFFCRGLLQDFGIVMAAGAAFGMMSTIAIVVVSVKSAYGRPAGLDSELAVTA